MDNSLDILKGMTLGFNHMQKLSEFQHIFERYIKDIGMESFFFCQCGSRESYYEELELMAEGATLDRDDTVYPDTVWCPLAYEDGEWSTYPSFDRELLFPPSHHIENKGGYYIVMPVHQGRKCIGYSIIGNFKNKVSGRVLQHLVLGIDMAIGNIRNDNLMSTMLARINQKWQYDELTGLYNRSGFVNNANQMIEQAREEGRGIVVLFFDLDGLKAVNDQKGHEAGDRYIKAMADFLKGEVDLQDIVCRYGGDEYIVLSQKSSPEEGKAMMKLITSHLQPPLSASVGCEFGFVSGMDGLNRMIEAADKRMYVQKRAKKLNR